jgi:hypothetical protein
MKFILPIAGNGRNGRKVWRYGSMAVWQNKKNFVVSLHIKRLVVYTSGTHYCLNNTVQASEVLHLEKTWQGQHDQSS